MVHILTPDHLQVRVVRTIRSVRVADVRDDARTGQRAACVRRHARLLDTVLVGRGHQTQVAHGRLAPVRVVQIVARAVVRTVLAVATVQRVAWHAVRRVATEVMVTR